MTVRRKRFKIRACILQITSLSPEIEVSLVQQMSENLTLVMQTLHW